MPFDRRHPTGRRCWQRAGVPLWLPNTIPTIVRSLHIGKSSATSCIPPGNMTMVPIVLVTGADGFVGRHMVAALTRRDWHVRSAQRSACPANSDADIVTGLDLGPSTDWSAALNGVQ